uniref:Uncharacterized protein n=1 Tax=Romanomermis culicivorax TaxID=13658 RepID=A0A915J083_ROMCU
MKCKTSDNGDANVSAKKIDGKSDDSTKIVGEEEGNDDATKIVEESADAMKIIREGDYDSMSDMSSLDTKTKHI